MRALLHALIIAKDSRPPSAISRRLAGFVRGLAIGGTMETTSVWHFEHDEPLFPPMRIPRRRTGIHPRFALAIAAANCDCEGCR
jgi:hypothetical protein